MLVCEYANFYNTTKFYQYAINVKADAFVPLVVVAASQVN